MKKVILASTSTVFNGTYLDYLLPVLKEHFNNTSEIIFIPYAQPGGISFEDYNDKVQLAFDKINIKVKGLHEFENKKLAIQNAKGIFTGGGNTFLLVATLYDLNLFETLKSVIESGTPYLGTSAGSNIGGLTMNTTNDMPIVMPKSFVTLGLIPFNLNPHYLDPTAGSTHMGETREMRINEFHKLNSIPVLGLREGSWLEIKNHEIWLRGSLTARLFLQNKAALEYNSGLLQVNEW